MKRDNIDFHAVQATHAEIHTRLENWARWCHSSGRGSGVLPMFQGYRPDSGYFELAVAMMPTDSLDAVRLQKLMVVLPEKNRMAIQWTYCHPYIRIEKVCRRLAVSRQGLHELVHTSRTMLKNRC